MIEIKRHVYSQGAWGEETIIQLNDATEGALVHRELMGDHYVKLPFSLEEPIHLQPGDFCTIDGYGFFELTEPYSPKFNTETGGYDYELVMDAYYFKWKNRLCRYITQNSSNETSFKLTSTLSTHLDVIVRTINAIGDIEPSFKYDGSSIGVRIDEGLGNVAKFMQYNDINIISALDNLATLYDCEWWVDDNYICFGRLELEGDPITFSTEEPLLNVSEMTSSESKKEFANRIYAFGSDRNLPKDYRKDDSADITTHGIVQKRLMLPLTGEHACPGGYVQDDNLSEATVVEAVMVDESIFPRVKCEISRVDTEPKSYIDEETGETVNWTIYRVYTNSNFRFSNSLRLEGEELHILFQSGPMNGMDFECIYDDEKKYYEIVTSEDYGRSLPDTNLHPAVGNEFVIYGFDATKISDTGIVANAEEELWGAVDKKLAKFKIDPNVYTCKMMSDVYEETMRVTASQYMHHDLGQKVTLISAALFATNRQSRIIGYEIKLDFPYDEPRYIVGEATVYSRTGDLQSQIDAITVNGIQYAVGSGYGSSGVFIISSTSRVPASDTNAYSAKRTDMDFLHKRQEDTAEEEIGFLKGLWIKVKGLFGFDGEGRITARSVTALGTNGNTVTDADNSTQKNLGLEVVESGIIGGILRVGKAILTKTIQSMNFTGGDSMFGTGWQLTDDDGNNNSRLVVDNLFVRMKSVHNKLEVRRYVAMGGNYVFSPAASIIEEVDYIGHDGSGNEVVLGYEYVRVPWVMRLVPVALFGKILSRKKMVRSSSESIDWSSVDTFRCWLRSDDGTTRTINTWDVGMLARCQTFNVAPAVNSNGTDTWNGETGEGARPVANKLYWRAVTGVGTSRNSENYSLPNHILEDGLSHNYIDLANNSIGNMALYLEGSDKPEAYDNIVCYGNWKDRSLSNIISIETVGSQAPVIRELLGVGYTDGSSIDWSLNNKERTRISPVAGNRFVAPSFVITTDPDEMDGESLYNEKNVGTAYRYDNIPGQTTSIASDGAIVLLVYSDIETDYALKTCHVEPAVINPVTGRPSGGGITWTSSKAKAGDSYINQQDGHRYVATATGWDDRGLVNESKSTLRVDMNGITARVSDAEGNISQLQQTAAGLVSMVSRDSLSRNILNGVLTGIGWKSGVWDNGTFTPSGNITIDDDGWFTKNNQADNCFALEGITLAEGEYMLSLCSEAVSETGTLSTDYPSLTCYLKNSSNTFTIATSSGAERRGSTSSIEVSAAQSGDYTLYIVSPKIRYPQLEAGTTITDFDAPVLEESLSLILQTADSISLSIVNKLVEVGINIDGNNRSIDLRGDKVSFKNADGTVSGKVYIDPTTGALVASDAIVNGIIATNASVSGVVVTEDATMMHKIVIDAETGGIIAYGPDHSDHNNNDLPAQDAEYGKTVEIGWGTDPDSNSRFGIISVHNAAVNNPNHGTLIDDKGVIISDQFRTVYIDSEGVSAGSTGIGWEALSQRRLRIARPSGSAYTANLNDDMIILTGNNVQSGFTITLPAPSQSDGKFYFIKNKKGGNAYVTCDVADSIMNDDNTDTSTTENIGDNSTLFFCDGEHWIMMQLDY